MRDAWLEIKKADNKDDLSASREITITPIWAVAPMGYNFIAPPWTLFTDLYNIFINLRVRWSEHNYLSVSYPFMEVPAVCEGKSQHCFVILFKAKPRLHHKRLNSYFICDFMHVLSIRLNDYWLPTRYLRIHNNIDNSWLKIWFLQLRMEREREKLNP